MGIMTGTNQAALLQSEFGHQPADTVLRAAMEQHFQGRIALVSSFGTESAVLLYMASQIDRHIPVIFLDTKKLFGETKRYRDLLVDRFGLTDVRTELPDLDRIKQADPDGMLFSTNPDLCCAIRKVEPLTRALEGFDAWITGRKAYQNSTRFKLPVFQADATHVKVNPLASWSAQDVQDYINANDLPRHPLEVDGYASIGCMPCTDRVAPGEDARSGRWRGLDKSECGIHMPATAPPATALPGQPAERPDMQPGTSACAI